MSWTDERVERLSKLWVEGRSASYIAAELGEGVSRNAVIGKIHRLGLSHRPPNPALDASRPSFRSVPRPADSKPPAAPETREVVPEAAPAAAMASDVVIPFSSRVTIMELRETMCRWPIGDPTSAEFRFCGCRTTGSIPYCAAHARVAFQPVADRRRAERIARIA